MKKKQTIIIVTLVIVICGAYFAIKSIKGLKAYQKQVEEITVSDINFSKLADGVYNGSYDVSLVAAKVNVIIKNHKITDIELVEHKNGKGKPAEIIPGKVIENQTLQIDVVSGATSSSKVILKAIENALNGAPK